jgi:hypothetical protein
MSGYRSYGEADVRRLRIEQRPAEPAEIAVACSLSRDGQATRFAEWAELLTHATGQTDADGGADITLHVRAPQGAEPLVAELLGQS